VAVVNAAQAPTERLENRCKLYDITGRGESFPLKPTSMSLPNGVCKIALPSQEPSDISPAYFLNLPAFLGYWPVAESQILLAIQQADELDYAKTEWYYTPQTQLRGFIRVQDLPKVAVRATLRPL